MARKSFPFMPLYTQDWLTDEKVLTYTLEEQGAYMRILMHLWQSHDATLPDNNKLFEKILGISSSKWKKLRSVLIDGQFAALHSDGEIVCQFRLQEEWRKAAVSDIFTHYNEEDRDG